MIHRVWPKEPFRAIQYTGKNAAEVAEAFSDAFSTGPMLRGKGSRWINEVLRDDGRPVEPDTWIVEVGRGGDTTAYLLIPDEYFQTHWRARPEKEDV